MAVKATIPATILFICCLPFSSLPHNAGSYLLQRRRRCLVDRVINFFLLSGSVNSNINFRKILRVNMFKIMKTKIHNGIK